MNRFCLAIALCAVLLMFSGCIYTHVTVPLDTNMSRTPSGISEAEGTVKHLALTGYVNFLWDSAAVGDIAREHGMETVYYSDLELLKILGIWNTYTVHIYGE